MKGLIEQKAELEAVIARCDEQIAEAFKTGNRQLYEAAVYDRRNADKAITAILELIARA